MTKKCPVCRREIRMESESLCSRCGWELKSTFLGLSIAEKALYAKKLTTAINNWEALQAYTQQAARQGGAIERAAVSREPEKEEAKAAEPVLYVESTPVPVLEKDPFEYPEEFRARIEGHPPVVAGRVKLLKEEYDLSTQVFPTSVVWKDWIRPLLEHGSASSPHILADRDLARSLYQAGSTHPVYVRLKVEGERSAIESMELYLSGSVIPVEMGIESTEEEKEDQGKLWEEPVTGMQLVRIEGGRYLMGCRDEEGYAHEKPVHEISLDGFWMGKYPVTQGEWKKVMGSNPACFKLGDDYPIESVSWLDAKQFITRLSSLNNGLYAFRLPTEAEWEYACRSGGKPEKYAGGDALDPVAWHSANSAGTTHKVGEKEPNNLGLYDMSGNVWEWCEDIYCDDAYSQHHPGNPLWSRGEPDRVIRGGSWYGKERYARCSDRGFTDQTYRRHYVGFRLVRIR